MINTIYLKCDDILLTYQIINNVRGVKNCYLTLLNEKFDFNESDKEVCTSISLLDDKFKIFSENREREYNYLKVEYEDLDGKLNTIIKYYLKTLKDPSNACLYRDKKSYFNYKKYRLPVENLTYNTIVDIKIKNSDTKNVEEKSQAIKIPRYDLREEDLHITMPNRIYLIFAFLVGLGLILIGETVYIIPAVGACLSKGIDPNTELLYEFDGYISLASKILFTILIILFIPKLLKLDFSYLKKKWYIYLIFVIVGFVLIYLTGILFEKIYEQLNILEDASNEETVIKVLKGRSGLAYAISVVTLTPFVEEFVFRKLTYSVFKHLHLPKILTILFTTLLFALIHCTSEDFTTLNAYIFLLNYFTLSLIITLTYAYTDENVFASTGLHILNNVLGLILM